MKCRYKDCDKTENIMKILIYYANGKPVYRTNCPEHEKEYWVNPEKYRENNERT